MKRLLIFICVLIISNASLIASPKNNLWNTKVSIATMKPFFENDQWFVTEDGFHLHPRTEDFTPGIYIGFERILTRRIGIEIGALCGFPPATLGVIDQFSPTGREYLGTERYKFLTFLLSPNLYLVNDSIINLYISPIIGYVLSGEKVMTPSFGPSVTWTKNNEPIYGAKVGVVVNTIIPRISVNAEIFTLSMNVKLESIETVQELDKYLGPLGLLIGISFSR